MSEVKHTRGEWKSFGSFVYQIDVDGYKRKIADCSSKPANIITVDEIMEDSANAHLIAAAPDLLEALKDCCVIAKPENPDCCCPNYQPLPDGDCAEAKNGDCHIWKAIQKARGQG